MSRLPVHTKAMLTRVVPISALLLVILFKFQNCAPPSQMDAVTNVIGPDGQVRIVDQWSEQKVVFLSPSVVVPETQQVVDLQGLCIGSHKGQLIRYQVVELKENPEVLDEGSVECVGGGFELPLAQVQFSSCSSRLQVRAARDGDDTNYAETVLRPECTDTFANK
ncbi:MAG: hypothetical protein A2Z20_06635 [Bdellovibrionales bacterium RBG_16_40_8]|nr:MAG: hypothetical protein A2Z20_06635 [Bdellovibrionales bacterium RBG_16_40_8]